MKKKICLVFYLAVFILHFRIFVFAAKLNDFYKPLIEKGSLLYSTEGYYFQRKQKGVNGQAAYDEIEANPKFFSWENSFRFSPITSFEIDVGFKNTFPSDYRRTIDNSTGGLGVYYDNSLDYAQDYSLQLRKRAAPFEIYFDFLEKRQKGGWEYAVYPNPPIIFDRINTHFEDISAGLRYISDTLEESRDKTNFSLLRRALLDSNQINIETELRYRKGKLRVTADQDPSGSPFYYYFYHDLKPHFEYGVNIRYGLSDSLEFETGLSVTTPLRYKYRYQLYYPNGTSNFVTGAYKLKNRFYFPFKLRYRPGDNFEIAFSSDYNSVNQRLHYWEKSVADVVTVFPDKELTYHNTQPTIELSYFHDNGGKIEEDIFSSLTKNLLSKNQWLAGFQYKKDITHLQKNSSNGTQNIINPYGIFFYPLDYFVAGSEYATAFTGNHSWYAVDTLPQNYYSLKASLIYGLTNNFNTGFTVGYHSSMSFHHFTLWDQRDRFYRVKPYYFFDISGDWRINSKSLLIFKSHFVPRYLTYFDYENDPQEYKSKDKYFEFSLALKVLF